MHQSQLMAEEDGALRHNKAGFLLHYHVDGIERHRDEINKVYEAMRLGAHEDNLPEYNGIINSIFEVDSRLDSAKFVEEACKPESAWLFDPEKIRERFERLAEPGCIGEDGTVEILAP